MLSCVFSSYSNISTCCGFWSWLQLETSFLYEAWRVGRTPDWCQQSKDVNVTLRLTFLLIEHLKVHAINNMSVTGYRRYHLKWNVHLFVWEPTTPTRLRPSRLEGKKESPMFVRLPEDTIIRVERELWPGRKLRETLHSRRVFTQILNQLRDDDSRQKTKGGWEHRSRFSGSQTVLTDQLRARTSDCDLLSTGSSQRRWFYRIRSNNTKLCGGVPLQHANEATTQRCGPQTLSVVGSFRSKTGGGRLVCTENVLVAFTPPKLNWMESSKVNHKNRKWPQLLISSSQRPRLLFSYRYVVLCTTPAASTSYLLN